MSEYTMSVSKEITIYEPSEDDIQSKKTHALLTSHDVNLTESFLSKTHQRHMDEFLINKLIISSLPSMMIKNIIYHALPIIEPENEPSTTKYKIHIQLPMAIKVAVLGRGIKIMKANDIISMIGIHFDTGTTFLQTTDIAYNFKDISFNERTLLGTNAFRDLSFRYQHVYIPRLISDITQNNTTLAIPPYKCTVRFNTKSDTRYKIKTLTSLIVNRLIYYNHMFEKTMNHIYSMPLNDSSLVVNKKKPHVHIVTDDTFNALGVLIDIPLENRPREFIYSTLHALGLWHLYTRVTLYGIEDKKVQHYINIMRTKMINMRISIDHKYKNFTRASNAAWLYNISRREFQNDYDALTTLEKDTVDAQHAREKESIRAVLANKCPHLALLRSVMRSRQDTFDAKSWSELRKYVPLTPSPAVNGVITLPKYESLLQCTLCKLSALCPHHYVLFDLTDSMFNGDVTKQMEYMIANFSIDKSDDSDTYYCRICGEALQRVIVEGESWFARAGTANDLRNDSLYNLMKAEVWQTLIANLEIGKIIIDRNDLTNNIIEIINPYIRRYEIKLSRVKTNTENMVSFSLYLIISAYTFVTIIHLVNITNGEIGLKGTPARGDTGMKLLHRLFNSAYKLLTTQRASTINKVPAFTPDRIKKIMTRGYQQISGSHIDIETTVVNYSDNILISNPVYDYIYYGWRLGSLMKGEKPVDVTDVKVILGVEFNEIDKLKMLFEKAEIPPPWPVKKGDKWSQYAHDVYTAAAKRFISNTYLLDIKHKSAIAKEYNIFKARRAKLLKERENYMNIRNGDQFPIKLEVKFDAPSLGLQYCADGRKHVWNIYIYEFDKGDNPVRVEVKTNEFGKKNISGMKYVTRKCSVCGDLFGKTDSNKIKPVLTQIRYINTFYVYYSNRCPIKNIHVWKDKTCVQCGVTKEQMEKKDIAYFEKYKDTFAIVRTRLSEKQREPIQILDDRLRNRRGMVVAKMKPSLISYKQWEYRNDSVVTLSKTMDIPYNILINLGFLHNVQFELAAKGKINPANSATDALWNMQVATIGSYINDVVVKFNRFIRCNTTGMHMDLEEFCKVNHNEVRQFAPIDLTKYNDERSIRKRDKPRLYANWMLVSFCDILLNIYNSQINKKISQRFVEIYVKSLMDAELNMSKPQLYKKIVAVAKQLTDNITYDTHINPDETDVSAKQFIDTLETSAFSTDDIDVEDYAASTGIDDI